MQKDDREQLYFIALIPPTPVHDDALSFKQYFKERYQTKAALNSPPHITLHMPFRWKVAKENILVQKLQAHIQQLDPVKVCLDNFNSFPPRVIFLNVLKSEVLSELQRSIQRFCKRELNLHNANYKEEAFHPHLTLAFRDLKKAAYKTAWDEFSRKEYKAEFIADKITLLKHNGKSWDVYKEFTLESSYSTENKKVLNTLEG